MEFLVSFFICIYKDLYYKNGELQSQYTILQTFRLSSKLGFSSVISDLYSIDTFLVQNFSTPTQAGGFSLIQKNRNLAVLGFSVFGSKLRLAVSQSKDASRKLIKNEWEILAVNSAGLLIVFIASPNLIDYFYGPDYLELTSVMRVGVLVFLSSGLCIVLQSHISGNRDDAFISIFTGFSTLLSLIAVSVGADIFGALGASVGLLISFFVQIIVLVLRIVSLSHKV